MSSLPTNFGVSRTFHSGLINQQLSDASRDLAILIFDLFGRGSAGRAHDALRDPRVRWGGDTSSPFSSPLASGPKDASFSFWIGTHTFQTKVTPLLTRPDIGSYRWTRACWFRLRFVFTCVFFWTRDSLFVLGLSFLCVISFSFASLVVRTSVFDCVERPVSEMTNFVLNETLNYSMHFRFLQFQYSFYKSCEFCCVDSVFYQCLKCTAVQ